MHQLKRNRFSLVFIGHPNLQSLYDDLMKLYYCQLVDLGYQVDIQNNRLHSDRINLLFGNRLFEARELTYISQNFDYIIMQFEQLSSVEGWFQLEAAVMPEFMSFFRAGLAVWDYSLHNLKFLAQHTVAARCLTLGYHSAMQEISPSPTKDIDVLFYGSHTERRFHLLEQLSAVCQVVRQENCRKTQRNALIRRSKIVLNLHCYEKINILEEARVFYLLSNQAFVISEASLEHPYGDALVSYDYDDLVAGVLSWLDKSESEREAQMQRGRAVLQAIPFRQQLQEAIAALPL